MVRYKRNAEGQFFKERMIVPTFYEPDVGRRVFSGEVSLYYSSKVFSPDGNFLPVWGSVMIIAIVYQSLIVPYEVGFNIEDTAASQTLDFICTMLYFLDVLCSCNTGFYKNGLLIVNRREIVYRYVRSWLVWDILSSFPYDWIFQPPFNSSSQSSRSPTLIKVVKIGRLLRSLRLVRIVKVKTHLVRVQQKFTDTKVAFLLTSLYLLVMLLGIAHWVACGFFYVSHAVDSTSNWVQESGLQNSEIEDLYVASLYWAMATLTTLGYGDLHPVNTSEKLYGITIMLLSAAVFSLIIGKIGATISMVDKDAESHKDFIINMTRYLRKAQVPESVIFRALRYMDFVWETRKTRKTLDMRLLNHFSEPLKNEICEHIYRPILSGVPCLARFDRVFTSQLARAMASQIFAQDDLIFQSGQTRSELYFVDRGKVEIYHHESEHTFAILRAGNHFGEVAFFTGEPRSASARCLEFSELLILKRGSMMSLMTPESSYTYSLINELFHSKAYDQLGLSCYICLESSHLAAHCPQCRVVIDHKSISQKWINKRRYNAKTVGLEGGIMPNFERRERTVKRAKHFVLENVKSADGYRRLPRAGYHFRKKVSEYAREFKEDRESVVKQEEDMEYCPVTLVSQQSVTQHTKIDNVGDVDESASSRCSEDLCVSPDEDSAEPLHTFPRSNTHDAQEMRFSHSWVEE